MRLANQSFLTCRMTIITVFFSEEWLLLDRYVRWGPLDMQIRHGSLANRGLIMSPLAISGEQSVPQFDYESMYYEIQEMLRCLYRVYYRA